MALTLSTGVVNAIASGMGWGDVIKNSIIKVYSGTQPTSANDSATGTLLCQFTTGTDTTGTDAAHTSERPAICRVVLAGGSGDVNMKVNGVSITGGAVAYTTSLVATKNAVVSAINSTYSFPDFYAVAAGDTVGGITYGTAADGEFFVLAPKNSGTTLDSATVLFANTTITAAINGGGASTTATGNFASGTNGSTGGSGVSDGTGRAAVTCLTMTYPAVNGLISKSGTWQDAKANASGSAGYFRMLCTPYFDDGTTNLSTTHDNYKVMRIDGTVGTSGADMIISSTSIAAGASQTINQFDLTVA